MSKKEREICQLEKDFKKFFCCRSDPLSNHDNDDITYQRPGLKTSVKNDIFWPEIGSGFAYPHQEFPGVPPQAKRQNNFSKLNFKGLFKPHLSEIYISYVAFIFSFFI